MAADCELQNDSRIDFLEDLKVLQHKHLCALANTNSAGIPIKKKIHSYQEENWFLSKNTLIRNSKQVPLQFSAKE